MSKLHPAKQVEVIRLLEKKGFRLVRQSGSHAIYRHSDERWTTVPIHSGKEVTNLLPELFFSPRPLRDRILFFPLPRGERVRVRVRRKWKVKMKRDLHKFLG